MKLKIQISLVSLLASALFTLLLFSLSSLSFLSPFLYPFLSLYSLLFSLSSLSFLSLFSLFSLSFSLSFSLFSLSFPLLPSLRSDGFCKMFWSFPQHETIVKSGISFVLWTQSALCVEMHGGNACAQ